MYECSKLADNSKSVCPIARTVELIGGKYKAVILWHLKNETLRYSQLHRKISCATDKMLAQQLRELENDGLIIRKVYPVVPPKTEYSLTQEGNLIIPVLEAMREFEEKFSGNKK